MFLYINFYQRLVIEEVKPMTFYKSGYQFLDFLPPPKKHLSRSAFVIAKPLFTRHFTNAFNTLLLHSYSRYKSPKLARNVCTYNATGFGYK